MALGLLKSAFPRAGAAHLPDRPSLKPSYDVVIIGAGAHGMAIAYHLARYHGIRRVAVLDRGYLGGGNTARNTAVIRSNYLTEESVRFYRESVRLFRELSNELDYNILFENRGQLTLAHSDSDLRNFRWRAEVNKELGVRSELVDLAEVQRRVPLLDCDPAAHYPVLGGLWHADGATARHDAVVWGYARAACRLGVELHPLTEVTGLEVSGGAIRAVETARGTIACDAVVQAVAGMSSEVARLADIDLPIHTYPLQALVTQPYKPVLTPLVSSPRWHVYIQQTSRGEFVIGGGCDPYPLYQTRSTLDLKEALCRGITQLFPFLAEANILRQWGGITDMTPDYSPVMGHSPVDNYFLDAGWGTWGFKATPICGVTMAELVASGQVPELIRPFALERFYTFDQVNEAGATAASH
ncbi:MAG: FAD-dependent oxidoreductase [Xanthomonadales bacterium]|nr:FAD-dependent oxidoreductase [Xanthomonadales bacterium]NIN58402.1 FAD-dependent oxidoreductase [Xanthomonadales bacterium]NIN73739.1 FAD-dependent oxidoreductase [Xanthomonadales bacterium]NIO14537.1 FAD-dependent oxidoreductase [Xanthomonadales bacterium]NIP10795.1 FAD-dependent oxidoreductase [Xanthomonadales bacterium]